jgi:hypothetical protein
MYYHGLPSGPKLIARSSTTPWPHPHQWPENKKLDVATGHAIQQPWNDPRGTLQQLIIRTLSDIDWTAIDILRVGYESAYENADRAPECPVTMLISVSENSTSFHQAETAIVECKQILARLALDDVEVEVKESIVCTAASNQGPDTYSPTSGPQALRLTCGPFNNDVDDVKFQFGHHVSEYIGTSIGVRGPKKGTKSLYLQGNDNKTYALTCRHVLFTDSDFIEYRSGDDNDKTTKQVIQPAEGTLVDTVTSFFSEKSGIETGIHLTSLPRYNTPAFQVQRLDILQKRSLLESCQPRIEQLQDYGSFTLGRVEFSPPIQVYSDRVRDWALVELSQESFTTRLGDLTNKVPVTQQLRDAFDKYSGTVSQGTLLPVAASLEATIGPHIIPEAELENTAASGLIVIKYGCKSGLTFGLSNGIRSIVRRPAGPGPAGAMVSNEWCIIGVNSQIPFSKGGDSGACVFDLTGRIGGIMTAGLKKENNPDGVDVTYATPMQWLLDDIKRQGYDVKLPN